MFRTVSTGVLWGALVFILAALAQMFADWLQVVDSPAFLVLTLGLPSAGWVWVIGVGALVASLLIVRFAHARRSSWWTAAITIGGLLAAGSVVNVVVGEEAHEPRTLLVALLVAGATTLLTWAAAGVFVGLALRRGEDDPR